MSEDITVLREIAFKVNNPDWLYFDNLRSLVGVELPKALAILCRREIERMERETRGPDPLLVNNALSVARDEGWNEAIAEARRVLDMCDQSILEFAEPQALIPYAQAVRLINALRKGPSHG